MRFKQKFYRVFDISSYNVDEKNSFDIQPCYNGSSPAMFDTEKEAEDFIQQYNKGFYQLTILPVWE